jgi:phosphoenolpyruvate carboxykinase (GTP)
VVGYVPRAQDFNTTGLDIKAEALAAAMKVDLGEWQDEIESQKEWFDKLGPTLPKELTLQRELLLARVKGARNAKK